MFDVSLKESGTGGGARMWSPHRRGVVRLKRPRCLTGHWYKTVMVGSGGLNLCEI